MEGDDGGRSTARSMLRRLGPALTTTAPWEPPPPAYPRSRLVPPYSPAELGKIARDVERQSTPARRHTARAFEALGLGVGLDGHWNTKVRGTDVVVAGGVVVSVPNPRSRLVEVRGAYADRLAELAKVVGDRPLVGRAVAGGKAPARLAAEIEIDQGRLQFEPRRLRSNWLVAHMEAGTHLPTFLQAAGLKTFGSLEDLLPYVCTISAAEARRQLRGA